MHKIRITILLLMMALLLTAGAVLPGIVAAVQDDEKAGEVGYSPIQSIELKLTEERETLPMLGKLSLLNEGLYSISEDEASMTQEDVREAVERELAPYYEWEMIPYNWKDPTFIATPYLAYGAENDAMYCIFWEVAVYCDAENPFSLNLYVDDDTGKILWLHFDSGSSLEIYDQQSYLELFHQIYFDSLGMTESAQFWEENELVEDISQNSGAISAVRYTFGDMIYGEINIEFYVYSQGFYILLP